MKNTKHQLSFFSFYDFPTIEKHLSEMALEGWMLKSAEGTVWKYERIEPKQLHFAVTYFPKASALDPEPSDELKMLWNFCEHTGWKLAVQAAQIQIFYNESENPRPIETDPVAQIENIHRAAKKSILVNFWLGLLLGIMNLGLFAYQLFTYPVDTLANASRLCSGCMWSLYLISTTAEPLAYFRWHKKAQRIALEEDRLLLPKDTRFTKNTLFTLLMTVLVCMLLSLPGAGAVQGIVFGVLYMTALIVIVRTIMRYLKRRKVSAKINFTVTMLVSIAMSVALVGVLTFAIIKSTEQGFFTDSNAAGTYEHDGMVWEYYDDELPLTIEDLTGEQYESYSYHRTEDKTIFLTKTECRQNPRYDADNFKELPDIEYTIITANIPGIFTTIKNAVINERQDEIHGDYIFTDHYEAIDATPWGADEAYQLHWSDSVLNKYLLIWDERIVEITFYSWEPTPEQMAVVANKLTK